MSNPTMTAISALTANEQSQAVEREAAVPGGEDEPTFCPACDRSVRFACNSSSCGFADSWRSRAQDAEARLAELELATPAHRPPQPGVATEELREDLEKAVRAANIPAHKETDVVFLRASARLTGDFARAALSRLEASQPAAETAPDAGLVAELRHLERAATKVAKYGAQPGPQWTILAGALISARAALSRAGERTC